MLFKVLEAPESAFEIWLWNILSCNSLCLGLNGIIEVNQLLRSFLLGNSFYCIQSISYHKTVCGWNSKVLLFNLKLIRSTKRLFLNLSLSWNNCVAVRESFCALLKFTSCEFYTLWIKIVVNHVEERTFFWQKITRRISA